MPFPTLRILFVDFAIDAKRLNFGLAYLSAISKRLGHETSLLQITSENPKEISAQTREGFLKVNPHIVAISVNDVYSDLVLPFASACKKENPDVLVVVGGSYPTLTPKEASSIAGVDVAILGEAEETFSALLQRYSKKTGRWDLSGKLRGALFKRKNGKILFGGMPSLPEVNDLPLPDVGLFPKEACVIKTGKTRNVPIVVSRGCFFSCTYCYASKKVNPFGKDPYFFRRLSDKKALELALLMKEKFSPDRLHFRDNLLFPNKKVGKSFSEKYRREIGLPSTGLMRPELCDREMARIIERNLVKELGIGFESASQEFRAKFLGRDYSNETAKRAFLNVRERGTIDFAYTITGLPYQSRKEILETYRFVGKNVTSSCNSLFFPTKGTSLGELCHRKGWIRENNPRKQRSIAQAETLLSTNGILGTQEINTLFGLSGTIISYYKGAPLDTVVSFSKFVARRALSSVFGDLKTITFSRK